MASSGPCLQASSVPVRSVALSCPALRNLMDCSPPGSSVRGISQARVLEWVCHLLLQGIFLTQGWDLHWQVGSLPLCGGPGVKIWPTPDTQGMTEVRPHHAGSLGTSRITERFFSKGSEEERFTESRQGERSMGTCLFSGNTRVALTGTTKAAG